MKRTALSTYSERHLGTLPPALAVLLPEASFVKLKISDGRRRSNGRRAKFDVFTATKQIDTATASKTPMTNILIEVPEC